MKRRTPKQQFAAVSAMLMTIGIVTCFTLDSVGIEPARAAENSGTLICGEVEQEHIDSCYAKIDGDASAYAGDIFISTTTSIDGGGTEHPSGFVKVEDRDSLDPATDYYKLTDCGHHRHSASCYSAPGEPEENDGEVDAAKLSVLKDKLASVLSAAKGFDKSRLEGPDEDDEMAVEDYLYASEWAESVKLSSTELDSLKAKFADATEYLEDVLSEAEKAKAKEDYKKEYYAVGVLGTVLNSISLLDEKVTFHIKYVDDADNIVSEPHDGQLTIEKTGGSSQTWKYGMTIVSETDASDVSLSGTTKIQLPTDGSKIKISENVKPSGYESQSATATFKLKNDGELDGTLTSDPAGVWSYDEATKTFSVKYYRSEKVQVIIKKVKEGSSTELPKADLKLYEGTTVKEAKFNSGKKFDALYVGTTYKIEETSAPQGYKYASDATFKINNATGTSVDKNNCNVSGPSGGVFTVEIADKPLDDLTMNLYTKKEGSDAPDTSKAQSGWSYKVRAAKEADGKKPSGDSGWGSWTAVKGDSKDAVTLIKGSELYANCYYQVLEETSPVGHEFDNDPITFLVDTQGDITKIEGQAASSGSKLQAYNNPLGPLYIHKIAEGGNTELAGAMFALYTGNASTTGSSTTTNNNSNTNTNTNNNNTTNRNNNTNSNSNATQTVTNAIETWTSDAAPHKVDTSKLQVGVTYKIKETKAPVGYATPSADFQFTIGKDNKVTVTANTLITCTSTEVKDKDYTVENSITIANKKSGAVKTGDHKLFALWLDLMIVAVGGMYLSGFSIADHVKAGSRSQRRRRSHHRRRR